MTYAVDGQVLLAIDRVGHRALEYSGADVELPQDVTRLRVDALDDAVRVAVEDQATRGGHRAAEERQVLLDAPGGRLLHRIPGLELREVPARAGLVEVELGGEVELARCVVLRLARDIHAQVEGRDVDQPGLSTVGHRLPVLTAEEVRAHVPRPSVQPGALFRVLDRTAGGLVDALGPVDFHERLGRAQLAGLAIGRIEEAVAVGLHQRRDGLAADPQIGEHRLVDAVIVPHVGRRHLIGPGDSAGIGVERDLRGRVEVPVLAVLARVGAARVRAPWSGVARAPVDEVELGIVRAHVPGGAGSTWYVGSYDQIGRAYV